MHLRAVREVRSTEKGGSLTSPSTFPSLPRRVLDEGGKAKRVNEIAEIENVTLERRKLSHNPLSECDSLGLLLWGPAGEHRRENGEPLPFLFFRGNPLREIGLPLVDSEGQDFHDLSREPLISLVASSPT